MIRACGERAELRSVSEGWGIDDLSRNNDTAGPALGGENLRRLSSPQRCCCLLLTPWPRRQCLVPLYCYFCLGHLAASPGESQNSYFPPIVLFELTQRFVSHDIRPVSH